MGCCKFLLQVGVDSEVRPATSAIVALVAQCELESRFLPFDYDAGLAKVPHDIYDHIAIGSNWR